MVNFRCSPPLPDNCVTHAEIYGEVGTVQQVVVVKRPVMKRPYNHFGETWEVYYPKLLFLYKVDGQKVKDTSVVAYFDEVVTEATKVYHFPFGNVFNDHRLCLGSYRFEPIKNLTDLNYQPEQWYLIEHNHANNAVQQKVVELLEASKEQPLNESMLRFSRTYKQLLENFIGRENNSIYYR